MCRPEDMDGFYISYFKYIWLRPGAGTSLALRLDGHKRLSGPLLGHPSPPRMWHAAATWEALGASLLPHPGQENLAKVFRRWDSYAGLPGYCPDQR